MQIREVIKKDYGKITVAIKCDGEIFYKLVDVSKLLNVNGNKVREKIDGGLICTIAVKKTKHIFISKSCIDEAVKLSEIEKAEEIRDWLKNLTLETPITKIGYTAEDLKDPEKAQQVLQILFDHELAVSVLQSKIDADKPKVELVDKLYGTDIPINLRMVYKRVKFQGLSYNGLLEILRGAGVVSDENLPHQKYIDEGYFRVVKITNCKGSEEFTIRTFLVYQKGIRYIEELIKKRVGKKINV